MKIHSSSLKTNQNLYLMLIRTYTYSVSQIVCMKWDFFDIDVGEKYYYLWKNLHSLRVKKSYFGNFCYLRKSSKSIHFLLKFLELSRNYFYRTIL